MRTLCLSGGEAQADRAHSEWEEDSSGCQLSFPGAVRVLVQGMQNSRQCLYVFVCVGGCVDDELLAKFPLHLLADFLRSR